MHKKEGVTKDSPGVLNMSNGIALLKKYNNPFCGHQWTGNKEVVRIEKSDMLNSKLQTHDNDQENVLNSLHS